MKKAITLVSLGLLGAAVAQELAKPAGEREWCGDLGGVVPYDLRMPTLERLLSRVWALDDPRILTPNGFGVGWTVNFGRLVQMARGS